MVNQSVNEFYNRFLLKIDALPQYVVLPLDIATTLFNNLSPDVRKLYISEGVHTPPRPPTKTNHQENQRLFLVRNVNNKSGSETSKRKQTPQDMYGNAWGKPLNSNVRIGQ